MKYLLTVLIVLALIATGCKKNTTDSKDNENEVKTYSTINVKTSTDYFSFATNSGSTAESSPHDVIFYSEMWTPPGAPVTINDPRFKAKNGIGIAVLTETNLEDITNIPANGEFVTNFISEMGEWYYETSAHVILPLDNVYIVNTTDGKFPAFEIISYYDDMGESGEFKIEWKYLSD